MDSSPRPNPNLIPSLHLVSDYLNQLGIPYALTGGMALAVWGQPRSTADVDLFIAIASKDIELLQHQLGSPFVFEPEELPFPHMRLFRAHLHGETKQILVTVDMIVVDSSWTASIVARRKLISIQGKPIWVTTVEDLLLLKLFSLREKDHADCRGIILQRGDQLDREYLETWANTLGTSSAWNHLLESTKS